VPAIVAGFLLTAVPNWTGRLPVVGMPLALVFGVWVAGRLAVAFSVLIGALAAATIDVAFLVLLGSVVAREIVAAGNTRNLKVLAGVALLAVGNAISHAEVMTGSGDTFGLRLGLAGTIALISLIGGRIIPSFTRNWLAKRQAQALPEPFGRFDLVAIIITAVALAGWVAAPSSRLTAAAAMAAMTVNAWRLARWSGGQTVREPLVLVLHVAFAFVPIGFGLVALSVLAPSLVTPSGAVHGWTAGAIGLMTLAVMTRASLGHTGEPLTATRTTILLYVLVAIAALTRIVLAFGILSETLLIVSAAAWVIGFAGFTVSYGPLLTRKRA
jgi:uncharacterized protein involved in response to NO